MVLDLCCLAYWLMGCMPWNLLMVRSFSTLLKIYTPICSPPLVHLGRHAWCWKHFWWMEVLETSLCFVGNQWIHRQSMRKSISLSTHTLTIYLFSSERFRVAYQGEIEPLTCRSKSGNHQWRRLAWATRIRFKMCNWLCPINGVKKKALKPLYQLLLYVISLVFVMWCSQQKEE